MGAMSMTFRGTVEVAEQDDAAHRALLRIKSRDTGGQGYATPTSTFALDDGGGTIHTAAQISGKAASMGEGVVATRARRADQGLHEEAGGDLSARPDDDAADARGRGAARRRHRGPGATRTARCSAATGPTTTCASSAGTCSRPAMDPEHMTKGSASAAAAAGPSTSPSTTPIGET